MRNFHSWESCWCSCLNCKNAMGSAWRGVLTVIQAVIHIKHLVWKPIPTGIQFHLIWVTNAVPKKTLYDSPASGGYVSEKYVLNQCRTWALSALLVLTAYNPERRVQQLWPYVNHVSTLQPEPLLVNVSLDEKIGNYYNWANRNLRSEM